MKTLSELIDTQDPCWPLIQEMIGRAVRPVRVLPRIPARAEAELLRAQVSTRSPLGALIYETGGLVIDNGWLRFLGSGCAEMDRSAMSWNYGKTYDEKGGDNYMLVADDAIGGFFAVNLGAFGKDTFGQILYFAPDTIEWELLGIDMLGFIEYAICGALDDFYESNRWAGWQDEATKLSYDACIGIYPPLWSKMENRKVEIANANKRSIPIGERWSFQMDLQRKLSGS